MLTQMGNRYLVMLNYEMNKSYISKNLCENRSKPKSCCHGKCYLKKQLAKADKEEGLPEKSSKQDMNDMLFFAEIKQWQHGNWVLDNTNKHPHTYNCNISAAFSGSIFHPPQI